MQIKVLQEQSESKYKEHAPNTLRWISTEDKFVELQQLGLTGGLKCH